MAAPQVILYELNEVPWEIVDLYIQSHPESTFARLSRVADTRTTVNDDPAELSPWRTWPTVHRSMYTKDHNSYELGQDPATFVGVDVWDVLDAEGVPVGLFGPLQSWPARQLKSGGFYVPDTFASDAKTYPPELSTFQDFNLRMTSENSFSADAPLSPKSMALVGVDLVRRGLKPQSMVKLARHLVNERRDRRFKGARPMMQVVPSFDLFWKLFQQHQPRFTIFFTNHVAAMMHRYWGDAVPGYETEYDYQADAVYKGFVLAAMDLADEQLATIAKYVDATPGARLVVAASMGQGPVHQRKDKGKRPFLEDGDRLGRFLDCGPTQTLRAMHPMASLQFVDEASATAAAEKVGRVLGSDGAPVFDAVEHRGTTVTFQIKDTAVEDGDHKVTLDDRVAEFDEVGLGLKERIGGNNTAYHVPEGIFLDYTGRGRSAAAEARAEVSALDVTPSLLKNVFGVEPPESMQGSVREDLFV